MTLQYTLIVFLAPYLYPMDSGADTHGPHSDVFSGDKKKYVGDTVHHITSYNRTHVARLI